MEANNVQIRPPDAQQSQQAQQSQAVNTVLARLIQVATAALKAPTVDKAGNIIVNQIQTIVKTDRAILVPLQGKKRIFCISGDLEPCQDNPFSQAVHEIRTLSGKEDTPQIITPDTLPQDVDLPHTRKTLDAMGGTCVLWLPIPDDRSLKPRFALWLERWGSKTWREEEIKLLSHALVFFGRALNPGKGKASGTGKKRAGLLLAVIAAALMWLPLPSRINAPVQVAPDHPHYIFAPFDGIVDDLAVQPGETVKSGDLIFRYDTRVLERQMEEARGGVAAALAELVRLEGAAYEDKEARAKIPVQKLEVARKEAEVRFLEKQLELAEVRTESDGVVVLDDPDALIGAALQTGQMVLSIADPRHTKLKIMTPVTDAGLVQEGAKVQIRLDSDPLKTIPAVIERIGFDVRVSDERIPSVRVDAVWSENPEVTPGQRGIARIEGPVTRLGMQLFRKPLMNLRTLFGL